MPVCAASIFKQGTGPVKLVPFNPVHAPIPVISPVVGVCQQIPLPVEANTWPLLPWEPQIFILSNLTVPSKKALLNSKRSVPKSTIAFEPGVKNPLVSINCFSSPA